MQHGDLHVFRRDPRTEPDRRLTFTGITQTGIDSHEDKKHEEREIVSQCTCRQQCAGKVSADETS